ncbi:MAG: hypothetical protein Q8N95_12540 [Desulfobacterales bacterium]|nr:hypothetical protein [Desulfobacterales bacterium]
MVIRLKLDRLKAGGKAGRREAGEGERHKVKDSRIRGFKGKEKGIGFWLNHIP